MYEYLSSHCSAMFFCFGSFPQGQSCTILGSLMVEFLGRNEISLWPKTCLLVAHHLFCIGKIQKRVMRVLIAQFGLVLHGNLFFSNLLVSHED